MCVWGGGGEGGGGKGGGGRGGGGGELHKCPSTCIFWFCLLAFSESTNVVKIGAGTLDPVLWARF